MRRAALQRSALSGDDLFIPSTSVSDSFLAVAYDH